MSDGGPPTCVVCGSDRHRRLFEKGTATYWACSGCQLEVTWPLPTMEELVGYYERSYVTGQYKPFVETEGMLQKRAAARLRQIEPHTRRGRWLDIGCAKGDFVEAANQLGGVDSVGIELAGAAVEMAKAAGRNVVQTSIEDFETDDLFDTITAFDVIEHVRDPRKFLQEVSALVRTGGVVILTTPDTRSLSCRILRSGWYFYLPGEHLYHFNRRNLRLLLGGEGFEVVRSGPIAKHVSFDYSLAQFDEISPGLFRLFTMVRRVIPRFMRESLVRLRLGELLVVATKRPDA